jgi:hypothetical protein
MKTWAMLCSTLVMTLLGCSESPTTASNSPTTQPQTGGSAPPPPAVAVAREDQPAGDNAAKPAVDASAQTNGKNNDPIAANSQANKAGGDLAAAEKGVGVKGRGYGGGIITEPIHQYFNIQQDIDFKMIDYDLKNYHALHNRYPKDWEEFKKEILEPGNRQLPELPEGENFYFDGKTGQLFVQRPDPNAPPEDKNPNEPPPDKAEASND